MSRHVSIKVDNVQLHYPNGSVYYTYNDVPNAKNVVLSTNKPMSAQEKTNFYNSLVRILPVTNTDTFENLTGNNLKMHLLDRLVVTNDLPRNYNLY